MQDRSRTERLGKAFGASINSTVMYRYPEPLYQDVLMDTKAKKLRRLFPDTARTKRFFEYSDRAEQAKSQLGLVNVEIDFGEDIETALVNLQAYSDYLPATFQRFVVDALRVRVHDFAVDFKSKFENFLKLDYNIFVSKERFSDFFAGVSQKESTQRSKKKWTDDDRTNVRFTMRLSPDLVSKIDSVIGESGLNRSQWFERAFQRQLSTASNKTPTDWPEYKRSQAVAIRISPHLNDHIAEVSKSVGLSKTEWARRVARNELERASPSPSTSPSI
ncbi:MAG: hypothetical protein AAF636_19710 [Pseudomonadota bacterium]